MTAVLSHANLRQEILQALVRSEDPVTTVYVRAGHPEAGPNDLALRWQPLEQSLLDAGAPVEDVEVVGSAVMAQPPGDHALAVFASRGHVDLRVVMNGYDGGDVAVHGWPRLLPLIRWQQQRVPAVVAVVGHGDAHATAYDDDGLEVVVDDIVGADDEIERNFPGGWSQPRYQRRAVDSWRHNADQFADHIRRLATRINAQLILIAGDHREALLVSAALPQSLRDVTVTDVAACSTSDQPRRVSRSATAEAVRMAARRQLLQRLAAFDEAVGSRRAVEGPQDVGRALDAGQVQELVVVNGVAADELADVFGAAAVEADTRITIAERGDIDLVGGVGALLRFPATPPTGG